MNCSSYFVKTGFVILCLFCCFPAWLLSELPTEDILRVSKPVPQVQIDAEQLRLIERRSARSEALTRNILTLLALMFLFGAFCAIWAQNADKNPCLWFAAGFFGTLFAVGAILWLNPKTKRRKRHKRLLAYWHY